MQADRCLSLRKKIVIYVQHAACNSLKTNQIEFYLVLDTILRFKYSVSTLHSSLEDTMKHTKAYDAIVILRHAAHYIVDDPQGFGHYYRCPISMLYAPRIQFAPI